MNLRQRTVDKVLHGLKMHRGYTFPDGEPLSHRPSKKVSIRIASTVDGTTRVFFCGTENPQSVIQLVKPDVEATLKYVFPDQDIYDEDGEINESLDAGPVRHVIYVVNDRTVTKKSKEFLAPYEKAGVRWEVVFYEDFEINIMSNAFVPKYTLLPKEKRPDPSMCQRMKDSDRIARIVGAQIDDVLAVSCANADNGIVTYFRRIVPDV